MSDIFLSYAREDMLRAEAIAEALETEDRSVWWDRNIPAGKNFRAVILEEIGKARCVVVLWSAISVARDFVIEEADEGRRRGILLPVRIGNVEAPLGFRGIQTVDLSSWRGDLEDREFRNLNQNIGSLLGRVAEAEPEGFAVQDEREFHTKWAPLARRFSQWFRWVGVGASLVILAYLGVRSLPRARPTPIANVAPVRPAEPMSSTPGRDAKPKQLASAQNPAIPPPDPEPPADAKQTSGSQVPATAGIGSSDLIGPWQYTETRGTAKNTGTLQLLPDSKFVVIESTGIILMTGLWEFNPATRRLRLSGTRSPWSAGLQLGFGGELVLTSSGCPGLSGTIDWPPADEWNWELVKLNCGADDHNVH